MSQSEQLERVGMYLTIAAAAGFALAIPVLVASKSFREGIRKACNSRQRKVMFVFFGGWMLLTILKGIVDLAGLMFGSGSN